MRDAAHRRQHGCAIIEDLACSGFNLHLAASCIWVDRWDYCGESCAVCCAVLCCAVLCCAVLLLPFVLLVYAPTKVTKNVVLLPKSATESSEQIMQYILDKKSAQVLILGKAIYDAGPYVYKKPYRVFVVWVIISAKSTHIR